MNSHEEIIFNKLMEKIDQNIPNLTDLKQINNNKTLMLKLLEKKGWYLEFCSDNLKNDEDCVLTAINSSGNALGNALGYANERFKNNKEIALLAAKNHANALCYVSPQLSNDKEVVLAAIKNYGSVLGYASENLRKDREIVLEAVKTYGLALEFAFKEFKQDEDIVWEAISNNGLALKFAGESFKKNREYVIKAIETTEHALRYAHFDLRNDKEIARLAIYTSCFNIMGISKELQTDKNFILSVLKGLDESTQNMPNQDKIDMIIFYSEIRVPGTQSIEEINSIKGLENFILRETLEKKLLCKKLVTKNKNKV